MRFLSLDADAPAALDLPVDGNPADGNPGGGRGAVPAAIDLPVGGNPVDGGVVNASGKST